MSLGGSGLLFFFFVIIATNLISAIATKRGQEEVAQMQTPDAGHDDAGRGHEADLKHEAATVKRGKTHKSMRTC